MDDLDNLSDAQINEMVAKKLSMRIPQQPTAIDYESMSDDQIDELVAQKLNQKKAQDRPAQAALQGFGNAASFGYLPQIQAGVEKGIDFIMGNDVDDQLREQGFQLPEEKTYTETRDEYIKDGQSLQASNPKSSMAGNIAGGLASGIATAGVAGAGAKAASFGSKLVTAAKTGATIGAIRNPGDIEGETDLFQLRERIKNTAQDALTGAALQGGISTIGKLAKAVKESPGVMRTWSQAKAFKTSGAMLKDFRKAYGNHKVAELGQTMIDQKIVALGDDVAEVAKKTELIKMDVGQKISSIYEGADDAILKMDTSKLSSDAIKRLQASELDMENFARVYMVDLKKRMTGLSGAENIINRVGKELDEIAKNKNVSLGKLREVRQSIDEQINFSKSTSELKGIQDEFLTLRNKMQDLAKQRVSVMDNIAGTRMARDLVKANRDYSNLSEISKIAKDRVARDSSNAAFGLRERISGGAGAVVGGMVAGVPGAVAGGVLGSITTKIAKTHGTPFVAIAASKTARVLENNQAILGKFADPLINAASSPKKFVAAVELMLKKPEFKKKIQNINLNDYGINERELAGKPSKDEERKKEIEKRKRAISGSK